MIESEDIVKPTSSINPFAAVLVCLVTFTMAVVAEVQAQFTYVRDQTIAVSDNSGERLPLAWAGGLNAAHINTMDLDGDGVEDLVVFDKMANKLFTFVNKNNRWVFAPELESLFPAEVENWLLLKDYNCDGLKDLFTGDIFGMRVYENVSAAGRPPTWRHHLFYSPSGNSSSPAIMTTGFNGKINLQIQFDDLPALIDHDGDGDLDIFNIRYSDVNTVEYHKNVGIEKYGSCDSLDFERVTNAWGDFRQCLCEDFRFDGRPCGSSGGRIKHAGGKAILALDMDNDKDAELLFSEADCEEVFQVTNFGDINTPIINSATPFPAVDPIKILFPAVFYEDVDFDGVKDMIASTNLFRKDYMQLDLKSSVWEYKNVGSAMLPQFSLTRKNFLQGEMIDVGDNAVPCFFDVDQDGDVDLFIGNNSDASGFGNIVFFRNEGTMNAPAFRHVTDDYLNIRSLKLYGIKPQFADINGDGRIDLVFAGTSTLRETSIYYMINNGKAQTSFELSNVKSFDPGVSVLDNFHLTHINNDGLIDMLVGRWTGSLEYLRNNGSTSNPSFVTEVENYMGIGTSVLRQSLSPYTSDLNGDGAIDLLLADQRGKIGIISSFLENRNGAELTNIVLDSLNNTYKESNFGRCWVAISNLFDSERPAIVVGTVRGGLEILRNEDKDIAEEKLIVGIYPNPLLSDKIVKIESNLSMRVQVFSAIGKLVQQEASISAGLNELSVANLASGMYILKFYSGRQSVYHRIVIP